MLQVSQADAIVENDVPLSEYICPPTGEAEQKIAANIAGMIDDRACLQMEIGTLPTGVSQTLMLYVFSFDPFSLFDDKLCTAEQSGLHSATKSICCATKSVF